MPIGNFRLLNQEQQETIDAVLEDYGNESAQSLIQLSYSEDPWIEARGNLPRLHRGNRVIHLDAMANYYSALLPERPDQDE